MLSEDEVRERARYCCCVLKQLGWLFGNSSILPSRYMEYLGKSSLALAEDEFLTVTLQEAALQENHEQGLLSIIHIYEGLLLALCEVLETDMDTIAADIAPEILRKLAGEMEVDID